MGKNKVRTLGGEHHELLNRVDEETSQGEDEREGPWDRSRKKETHLLIKK